VLHLKKISAPQHSEARWESFKICNAQLLLLGRFLRFLSLGAKTTRLSSIILRPIVLWTASHPSFSPCDFLVAIVITQTLKPLYSQLGVLASYCFYFDYLYWYFFDLKEVHLICIINPIGYSSQSYFSTHSWSKVKWYKWYLVIQTYCFKHIDNLLVNQGIHPNPPRTGKGAKGPAGPAGPAASPAPGAHWSSSKNSVRKMMLWMISHWKMMENDMFIMFIY
jgi:hypothetical protein